MDSSTNLPTPVGIVKMREYKYKAVLGLSITQIIIGCLCILLMSLAMGLDDSCYLSTCSLGYGFQAGVLYCISGTLGCCSSKFRTNKCLITTFLVMNIISAAFAVVPLTLGFWNILEAIMRPGYTIVFIIPIMILSVIESVIAIITSAFCCKFLCECCNYESVFSSQALYDAKSQQFVPGTLNQDSMSWSPQNLDWSNQASSVPPDYDPPKGGTVSEFKYKTFK